MSANNFCPEINRFLEKLLRSHRVFTAGYAIIDKYKIVAADTVTILENINVSQKSLFQACSFSKTLTATGILSLARKNKLNLDASVNKQLKSWKIPEHKFSDKISVRQCLNMTSGLCYGEPYPDLPPYTQDKPTPTLKNILNGQAPATNHPISLYFMPGAEYHYSGAGYMVLQQLIEDVTEQPFSEFMQEHILKPLVMTNSSFLQPLSDKLKINAIQGFDAEGKVLKEGWHNIPTLASGGLWSTPTDLANAILAISSAYQGRNNKFLSRKLAIEMLSCQKNLSFGLGVVIDSKEQSLNFRKNGHNAGYHNELIMFPNTGQGIVIMTNSASGMLLITEFIAFIAAKYQWPPYFSHFDELNLLPPVAH